MAILTPSVIRSSDSKSLQKIIDSVPVATLIIGSNGLFIDCNKETLRIFEATDRDEIIGKPPGLLSPLKQRDGSDSSSESLLMIKKAQETGSNTFYWDHVTLKGTIFPARVTLNLIEYEGEQCLMSTVTDMTGNVRIEENEGLIRQNPYALLKLNPDRTIAEVNQAFLKMSGYKREEWIGRNISGFKILNRDGLTVEAALDKKITVTGRITAEFPTGIRNLEYSYIPVYDSDGKILCIFDIFADLTELIEKINEADSLISDNPASIITIDPTGKILSFNPSFLTLSHMAEEKLQSMKIQEFKILNREGQSFADILGSKKAGKGRLVIDFDWEVKVLDFVYIPVLDANGKVVRIVAMYIDITDQVTYIEEIQAFIRENPHAILTMKPDLSIIDVNPALLRIMGFSYEEITRMKLTEIKVLEREGQTIKDVVQNKKPAKGKMIVDVPAGIRHLDYLYIPIMDKKGNITHFVEILTDMTSIRSMVDYLEKSVGIVQKNISSLAEGDTSFTTTILDADEHSASAREQFLKIGKAVDIARQAITNLVKDSNAIAHAAISGDMKYRSDPSIHAGDYRTIIEGMNQTLESVAIPIRESLKIANDYANYNFATRFDPRIEIRGDWTQFKEALNNIGLQVSGAISFINKNVNDLASSAEEANTSIEEIVAGTQQIATNAGKVSGNADQGGDGISQVLRAMEDLNETVGAVSRKAETVSVSSNEANNLAKGGIDLAKKSEKAMGDITLSTEEVDSIVNGINKQMEEIGKIIRFISDIANQTNLLALNAAIEAARAGEAGRGFAVVAAEVKSLAQDSRKSAENIADMIEKLQTKAKEATEAMGKSTTAVMEGSNALQETLAAFSRIAVTIEQINQNNVEVASPSEEQAASVEEVTASIQEVSDLILSTSREAGDTAAAIEEASASVDEISRIIAGVVKIVDNISNEMTKFRLT